MHTTGDGHGQCSFTCAGYTIQCMSEVADAQLAHAALVDEFDLDRAGCTPRSLAVRRSGEHWPFLVVAMRVEHDWFSPGVILVPETKLLFVGAGERVLAYQLEPPSRLWEDRADTGFHAWEQCDDTILLSAELELAAWDKRGQKLWSMFVEPPWDYVVNGDAIEVDVMGRTQTFALRTGR